jgi:hypothetical protein
MDFNETITNILSRTRISVQLSGLGITMLAAAAIRLWLPGAVGAQIAVIILGILFVAFGQVFAQLGGMPRRSRPVFVLTVLTLFCTLTLTLIITTSWLVARALRSKAADSSGYSPAEKKLVDLTKELPILKGSYESLLDSPAKAAQVNKDARQLIGKMSAVSDEQLGQAIKIFKYESLAYIWAIVARSESNSNPNVESEKKLESVGEILRACDNARTVVSEVMRPGPYDQRVQDTREWIKNDGTPYRIERLSAVGLCTRWEITKDPADRSEVRRIIHSLPKEYLDSEQPERSRALLRCLKDDN